MIVDRRVFSPEGGPAGGGAGGDPGPGAGGNPGGSTPNPGAGATPPAWHAGADAEIVGHWQNQGWDLSNPLAVATAATKAAREAAQFAGAPPSELIRLPKAGDEAGARAMWQRLGAPPDPAGYDLSAVKRADGTDLDPAFIESFRAAAHKFNLPKDQAVGLAAEIIRHQEKVAGEVAAQNLAKGAAEAAELRKNWGPNYDVNMFVAKNAAIKNGWTPEQIDGLQKTVGYAKAMETFRQMGVAQGEGRFLEGGANGGGVFTREQAVSKKADLMKDAAWVGRYLNGGAVERNEMTQLNTIIVGEDDTARYRAY